MFRQRVKVFQLLTYLILLSHLSVAHEVTIYPEDVDGDASSLDNTSILDVRTTPFFLTDGTFTLEDESDDASDNSGSIEIDIFAWKSKQRVVFSITNPVDSH